MIELTYMQYQYLLAICEKGAFNHKKLEDYFTHAPATVATYRSTLFEIFHVHSLAELIYKYHTNQLYEFKLKNKENKQNGKDYNM